ncbi:MAG: MEDS domain-containing protein, partial [Nitrososphaerales archaeon]
NKLMTCEKPVEANNLLSPEIDHRLMAMEPGTHGVLIYDSAQNKQEVLFGHLAHGKADSKLVYVCSEERPAQIREEMDAYGLDVDGLVGRDRLTISNFEEVYIGKDDIVDIPRIIDGFAKASWSCSKQGLGFRAAAEMSGFFRRGKAVELIEYERALGKKFYFPGMGVCAYNVVEMQSAGCLDILMPLLSAHGLVILTGPRGSVTMDSEQVRPRQVEKVLQVQI